MIEDLWYGRGSAAGLGRALLCPLAGAFGAGAALRAALYDRRWLPVAQLPVPVVSIGGLSVGGSGKTPLVLWLVERLRVLGLRPCVLTRGYGGTASAPLLLGSADAPASAATVAAAGDEAVLIAARSGVPVAVAADRVAGARLALQRSDPGIFVLDDGFQHRALARDLDIVIVSGAEDRLCLLPAGPLRERPAALARADAVVTSASGSARAASAAPFSGRGAAGAASAQMQLSMRVVAVGLVSSVAGAVGVARPTQGQPDPAPAALAGRRVAAVAAIARPERFKATLEEAGAIVEETLFFRDHHAYDAGDWQRIAALAGRCELVVTTEKDMIKLAFFAAGASWLAALRVAAEVEGAAALLERIAGFDRKRRPTHHPPTFGGPTAWG